MISNDIRIPTNCTDARHCSPSTRVAEYFPMPGIVVMNSNCTAIRIGIELKSESFRLLRKETRLNSINLSHGIFSNRITYQMPPLSERKNERFDACENPFYDCMNSFFQTLN